MTIISHVEADDIPDTLVAKLSDHVRAELEDSLSIPKILVARRERLWLVLEGTAPVAACGISRQSLLGQPPEFWMLNSTAISMRHLKAYKKFVNELQELYPLLWAVVDVSSVPASRFASFYGFADTGKTVFRHERLYKIYEARK